MRPSLASELRHERETSKKQADEENEETPNIRGGYGRSPKVQEYEDGCSQLEMILMHFEHCLQSMKPLRWSSPT